MKSFTAQLRLRPEASRTLRSLRAAGIHRIHMVTGDHPDVAELVGDALGIDRVFAERTPAEKVEVVRLVRSEGLTVMVGDGILRDEDPAGPLIQTHHEIHRLTRLYARLVAQLPADGPRTEDLRDLRRVLYGLHAILSLHFAQEEEHYSLFEPIAATADRLGLIQLHTGS